MKGDRDILEIVRVEFGYVRCCEPGRLRVSSPMAPLQTNPSRAKASIGKITTRCTGNGMEKLVLLFALCFLLLISLA